MIAKELVTINSTTVGSDVVVWSDTMTTRVEIKTGRTVEVCAGSKNIGLGKAFGIMDAIA